jgi:hypothetical protein
MKKTKQWRKRKIIFEELFEPTLKRKIKRFLESDTTSATLTRGLLVTAALGGVIAVGIMAPNLFKIFNTKDGYEERSKRISKDGFSRLRRGCYRLENNHWVEFVRTDGYGNKIYRITEKGRTEIYRILKQSSSPITKPAMWDGKWRVIFFDIPVSHNHARDAFRYGLRSYGCHQIQQSTFMHPFPCVKEIQKLTKNLGIEKYVKVYTVEDFDDREVIAAFRDLLK